METGGFLSHGAIVAREYGIPAVANIPGILNALQDGERITVDGSAGRVIYSVRQ
jgi:pyruvate,water dikinase